jgi:hypothetical protein
MTRLLHNVEGLCRVRTVPVNATIKCFPSVLVMASDKLLRVCSASESNPWKLLLQGDDDIQQLYLIS